MTTANVTYSDLMKMHKIVNMLISFTRSTFPHDPNHAGSTIHSVAAVPRTLLLNQLGSPTRQLFPYSFDFAVFTHVLLAHAWRIFLILAHFHIKLTNEKHASEQSQKHIWHLRVPWRSSTWSCGSTLFAKL